MPESPEPSVSLLTQRKPGTEAVGRARSGQRGVSGSGAVAVAVRLRRLRTLQYAKSTVETRESGRFKPCTHIGVFRP